jgi:hypothetical protein
MSLCAFMAIEMGTMRARGIKAVEGSWGWNMRGGRLYFSVDEHLSLRQRLMKSTLIRSLQTKSARGTSDGGKSCPASSLFYALSAGTTRVKDGSNTYKPVVNALR